MAAGQPGIERNEFLQGLGLLVSLARPEVELGKLAVIAGAPRSFRQDHLRACAIKQRCGLANIREHFGRTGKMAVGEHKQPLRPQGSAFIKPLTQVIQYLVEGGVQTRNLECPGDAKHGAGMPAPDFFRAMLRNIQSNPEKGRVANLFKKDRGKIQGKHAFIRAYSGIQSQGFSESARVAAEVARAQRILAAPGAT